MTARLQRLWVPGRMPTVFDLIAARRAGGSGTAYARLKGKWTNAVARRARAARLRRCRHVYLTFAWHEPCHRRDLDALVASGRKLVLDGLRAAGVLPTEGWTSSVMGWTDEYRVSAKPGVLVTLRAVAR